MGWPISASTQTSAGYFASPRPRTRMGGATARRATRRQMSRPLHVAGFCLSVARAADVISQRIADLKGVWIDVRFLQRRGVQIHIGAASIILNEAEAARSIPHLQFSCRRYFPFFSLISASRRRSLDFFRTNTILSFRARLSIADTDRK